MFFVHQKRTRYKFLLGLSLYIYIYILRVHVIETFLSLFMGICDEIEDATIAIDETKISEIEATI